MKTPKDFLTWLGERLSKSLCATQGHNFVLIEHHQTCYGVCTRCDATAPREALTALLRERFGD